MKKIENFRHQVLQLASMYKIYGGREVTSHRYGTYSTADGCCVAYDTKDTFIDCDGDGHWDSGESGTETTTIVEAPSGEC